MRTVVAAFAFVITASLGLVSSARADTLDATTDAIPDGRDAASADASASVDASDASAPDAGDTTDGGGDGSADLQCAGDAARPANGVCPSYIGGLGCSVTRRHDDSTSLGALCLALGLAVTARRLRRASRSGTP